ncbi:hypothetical protein SAMN05428945_5978 [Streptomyces sp. 2224.1]|uniref:hypothetical protein n=1 Tax=Streptomyces sp. 2224.1 TaxID=1881020 RepID=UPI00089876B7|nr:hypothetical protein [Streptomyces sp. 2224.1]SED90371.1 hypothetical protein SAMN05428945_5978 [Streptomyces sp. 2224.1]
MPEPHDLLRSLFQEAASTGQSRARCAPVELVARRGERLRRRRIATLAAGACLVFAGTGAAAVALLPGSPSTGVPAVTPSPSRPSATPKPAPTPPRSTSSVTSTPVPGRTTPGTPPATAPPRTSQGVPGASATATHRTSPPSTAPPR